jgi:hypothetical protein
MNRRVNFLLLCLLALASASAEENTLWQIGKLDQSSMEFSPGPRDHVLYQSGKSNWAKDWPGEQRTGSTYEIVFNLGKAVRLVEEIK